MTEVLHSPSHFPSSPRRPSFSSPSSPSPSPSSSISCIGSSDDAILLIHDHPFENRTPSSSVAVDGGSTASDCDVSVVKEGDNKDRGDQLPLLAFILTLFRKSLVACKSDRRELCAMEIGWPSNVRHVAHVTFDRFDGFLGLPVEFEPEVPRRPPSASTSVFGVSTESMQLAYDSRGNSVPTILLLMQRRLYAQGGLQAEGIFRINPDNTQEEYVRDELNRGVVPEGIDVHCLAGLIKAWFRELPAGVLDPLSPEQVMQCQTEESSVELARNLPPTEAALLDWAINLMADVVQQEHLNKMNARNIAMVFAPNMTQMADPLTALMYAVQVMNFLKTLIIRTLRERKDSVIESSPAYHSEPSDENGHHSPMLSCARGTPAEDEEEAEQNFVPERLVSECCLPDSHQDKSLNEGEACGLVTSSEEGKPDELLYCEFPAKGNLGKCKTGQSSNSSSKKGYKKSNGQPPAVPVEKMKRISNLSRIDLRIERIEAWR